MMIKKALIGGIQKFSTDDGPGIRTTVFLKGCPLNCKWCHNPELISFEQEIIEMPNSCIRCGYCIEHCPEKAIFVDAEGLVDIDRAKCKKCMSCVAGCFAEGLRAVGKEMTAEEVMKEVVKDKGFYDNTGGGMTISGGELLSQKDFAMELVKLAAEEDIHVCLDTSGCGEESALKELASQPNVTDILYDMKSLYPECHKELTGLDNAQILENLRMLASDPVLCAKLHMRMPLIHDLNDQWDMLCDTAALYQELGIKKVTLLPYHSLGVSKMKHIGGMQETYQPPEDDYLEKLLTLFSEIGMDARISSITKK